MERADGNVVAERFRIVRYIRQIDNYYLYEAEALATGEIVYLSEFFPDFASRTDDYDVVIDDEMLDIFDIWVTNLNTDYDQIVTMGLGSLLRLKECFIDHGTTYIVSELREGEKTISERSVQELTEIDLTKMTESYFGFLDTIRQFDGAGIYFHIDASFTFLSEELEYSLLYFGKLQGDESQASSEMAELYYFLLTGQESDGASEAPLEGLLPARAEIARFASSAAGADKLKLDKLRFDLSETYISAMKTKINIKNIFKVDPKLKLKITAIAATSAVAVILILAIIATGYNFAKTVIGGPREQSEEELREEMLNKPIIFDKE